MRSRERAGNRHRRQSRPRVVGKRGFQDISGMLSRPIEIDELALSKKDILSRIGKDEPIQGLKSKGEITFSVEFSEFKSPTVTLCASCSSRVLHAVLGEARPERLNRGYDKPWDDPQGR